MFLKSTIIILLGLLLLSCGDLDSKKISWNEASLKIEKGEIVSVYQLHSHKVYLWDIDDVKYVSMEPQIDDVDILIKNAPNADKISFITE